MDSPLSWYSFGLPHSDTKKLLPYFETPSNRSLDINSHNSISGCMQLNKDENVHRFALSSIRGKLLEREREREREKEKEKERERES